ncbi:MAG: tRNA (adenosine(37)-N6)-threonylcarbamoyltransferase complex transferase subunit TsaD [Firmicutes bacterium]|nr:tRNA (adenosine(37)-N6)-threonylcarbamoyltransferase complex transferase subunit TsaD [Bacillota bacterium]
MVDSIILGIETSCDETSAAIVKNGKDVLSNVISSQIDIHKKYGGVVPEVASRKHLEMIIGVIDLAIKEAGITKEDLTAIGVTNQPGLIGALLVGITAAKGLSISLNIPLIPVHHLRGHIYANLVEHELNEFPILALIVSGGHTSLAIWHNHLSIEVIGQTLDDAAGEAFDKIARKLGLDYPGGPLIEKYATHGSKTELVFPVAKLGKDSYNFSFSGLKSNVINYINKMDQQSKNIIIEDVAFAVQDAIVSAVVEKVLLASENYGIKNVVLGGGVTSNKYLLKRLEEEGLKIGLKVYAPKGIYCTDNGVMIGSAAYYLNQFGIKGDLFLNAYSSGDIK